MEKRFRQARAGLLGPLLVLSIVIAGCGGGGGDTTAQPATLTKAEYVKQADAICAKTESRQGKLVSQFQRREKSVEGKAATEKLISFAALPPVKEEIEELSKLPLPEKEAAEAKAYLKELEKGLAAAEKEPGTLLVTPGAFTKSEEVARAFGFKTCRGA